MIGFVNVFKSAGPTSAQVVARLRRIYGVYARDRNIAVGHLGTLDPQAAGVLPGRVGKATRLIPLLDRSAQSVCLHARVRTLDDDAGRARRNRRDAAPFRTTGASGWSGAAATSSERSSKSPPMFSAVHHEGKRLYELAREGKTVERKARAP